MHSRRACDVGRKDRTAAYAGGGRAGSVPTNSGTPAAAVPASSSSAKCHLGACARRPARADCAALARTASAGRGRATLHVLALSMLGRRLCKLTPRSSAFAFAHPPATRSPSAPSPTPAHCALPPRVSMAKPTR